MAPKDMLYCCLTSMPISYGIMDICSKVTDFIHYKRQKQQIHLSYIIRTFEAKLLLHSLISVL